MCQECDRNRSSREWVEKTVVAIGLILDNWDRLDDKHQSQFIDAIEAVLETLGGPR